jgi:hypothetical protein
LSSSIAFNGALSMSGYDLTLQTNGAVTQTAPIAVLGLDLLGPAGSYTLTNTGNSIPTISGTTGSVSLVSGSTLTVGDVGVAGLAASGSIFLQSYGAGSDLTLDAPITSAASGTAVTLVAGRNFINNYGPSAISLTAIGSPNWLIYSASPSADSFGNLNSGNTAVWNTAYGASISQSGDRYVFSFQPTLTFNSGNDTKTYGDDATSALASDYTVTGLQTGVANAFLGDTPASAYTGAPSVTSLGSATTAGVSGTPYLITISAGSVTPLDGYAVTYNSLGVLNVTPRPITVTADGQTQAYGAAVPNLTYTLGGQGLVNGDTLSGALATTASPAANVGTYAITQGSLSAGSNYDVSFIGALDVITPRPITVIASG